MTPLERLQGLVEHTARLIGSENLTPTQALVKTAMAYDLDDNDIDRVAGHVNTTAHMVHMVRADGLDRAKPFPLADPVVAKKAVTAAGKTSRTVERDQKSDEDEQEDEKDMELLTRTGKNCNRKKASAEEPAPSNPYAERMASIAVLKRAEVLSELFDREAQETRSRVIDMIGDLANTIRHRSSADRATFARRMVGRYGSPGAHVVALMWHSAGVDDSVPNSADSSRYVTFPADTLYKKASTIAELESKAFVMESNRDILPHIALSDSFTEDLLANLAALTASKTFSPESRLAAGTVAGNTMRLDDARQQAASAGLSPSTRLSLDKLRTRDAFMQAVMEDPNLRGYPLKRLTSAFNTTVQNEPSVVRNPAMLRAGMLQDLSSSTPDIFNLKTMQEVGKLQRAAQERDIAAREQLVEKSKAAGKAFASKARDFSTNVEDLIQRGQQEAARIRGERKAAYLGGASQLWKGVSALPGAVGKALTGATKAAVGAYKGVRDARTANQLAQDTIDEMTPDEVSAALKASGVADVNALRKRMASDISGKSGGVAAEQLKRATEAAQSARNEGDTSQRVSAAVDALPEDVLNGAMGAGGYSSPEELKQGIVKQVQAGGKKTNDLIGRPLGASAAMDFIDKSMKAHGKFEEQSTKETYGIFESALPEGVPKSTFDRIVSRMEDYGVDTTNEQQDLIEAIREGDDEMADEARAKLQDTAAVAAQASILLNEAEQLRADEDRKPGGFAVDVGAFERVLAANAAGQQPDVDDMQSVRTMQNYVVDQAKGEALEMAAPRNSNDRLRESDTRLGLLKLGLEPDLVREAAVIAAMPGNHQGQVSAFQSDVANQGGLSPENYLISAMDDVEASGDRALKQGLREIIQRLDASTRAVAKNEPIIGMDL